MEGYRSVMFEPKKIVAAALSAGALTGCAPPSNVTAHIARAREPISGAYRALRITPATSAYVIDGDTLTAGVRGRRVRVRLLGLDAPENTRRRDCFGPQATAALRRLLPAGAAIVLAVDRSRRDPYGRELAYVWRADGVFVNRVLIGQGFATTLFLPPPEPFRAEFAAEEAAARAARAGLWGACRDGFLRQGSTMIKGGSREPRAIATHPPKPARQTS
jgi:micrococcal nuclease